MKISHSFAYEEKDGGAVILRCFLRDGRVEVPVSLDGLPVRALNEYAFSSQAPCGIREEFPDNFGEALCGNSLKELVLPDTLTKVGRYCFYNCEELSGLEFSPALNDWGSGAFSGCHKIASIRLRSDFDEESALKEVLGEISNEVCVTFSSQKEEKSKARVLFPSFYEEGVENTPARILEDHVHGTGILYRNAFSGRKLDLRRYDSLFPYALAQENELLLIKLSLCRLCYPADLTGKAGEMYASFMREHLFAAGDFLIRQKNTERFSWLLENFTAEDEKRVLKDLTRVAADLREAQMQSILVDFLHRHPSFQDERKRLEL